MSNNDERIPVLLLKTKTTPDGYEEYFSSHERPYQSIFVPVLEHRFITKALDELKASIVSRDLDSGRYGGLIFTSQRAVEAFLSIVNDIRANGGTEDVPIDPSLPLYVVGPATARSVRAIGLRNPVLGEHTGTGEVLAGFMLHDYNSLTTLQAHERLPLLFMVGEQRRDIIPKTLQSDDLPDGERIVVDEVTVYETGVMEGFSSHFARVIQPHMASGRKIWIVVFSPTGCRAMLQGLGMLDNVTGKTRSTLRADARRAFIATIGPTTRDYLVQEFDFVPDVCAHVPTPEGVGRGIDEFERNRNN